MVWYHLNFVYTYSDDIWSINNPDVEDYLGQMYPAEPEIKDTTKINASVPFRNILLSVVRGGKLRASLYSFYDRRDDFNLHIAFTVPEKQYSIFARPWCFISHRIRCAKAYWSYSKGDVIWYKYLRQGYIREHFRSPLMKFYGRCGDSMKSPSPQYYMTFWCTTIYKDNLHWSDIAVTRNLVTKLGLITAFDLITKIREVSRQRLQQFMGVASWQRTLTAQDTLSSPIWDLHVSVVETILFWTFHVSGLWISNISPYFNFARCTW